jgi:hypothetical protein
MYSVRTSAVSEMAITTSSNLVILGSNPRRRVRNITEWLGGSLERSCPARGCEFESHVFRKDRWLIGIGTSLICWLS